VRGTGPGCGKDTVADHIAELLNAMCIQTHRTAFANGVREDVSKITGVPVEVIRTTEGKNIVFETLGVTIGKLLQYHGQAKKKLDGDDIWIRQCMDSLPTESNVVSIISDVRYKGEQSTVQERQGIVILVKTDRPTSAIQIAGRSLQHSSERDLDGIPPDFTIENNGTLEELHNKVKELINLFIG
jgi:dephospho-CoA kinase